MDRRRLGIQKLSKPHENTGCGYKHFRFVSLLISNIAAIQPLSSDRMYCEEGSQIPRSMKTSG